MFRGRNIGGGRSAPPRGGPRGRHRRGCAERQANPIIIEVIAPVATPIENYPDAQAGVEGAAAALNKKGGIKGQQIQVKFCNTNSNANSATACGRQAVSDGATFVTGYLGTQSALIIPILPQANIPIIGSRSGGNPIDWTSPDNFPIAGGSASNYQAIPFAMKKLGKKRFFIFYQDVPSAATNAKNVLRAARIAKLPVIGSMVLPGATTDFTPYVQKLRDANPDSVTFINSPGVSGGLMRAAEASRRQAAVVAQRRLDRRAGGGADRRADRGHADRLGPAELP